jgi:hypothetical protein
MKTQTRSAIPAVVTIAFLTLLGCGGASPTIGTGGGGAKVDAELARVSEVRRLLRSACGKLRAAENAPESAALLAEARGQTERALAQWRGFRQTHSAAAPTAYAAHEYWDCAAYDIEAGIQEMLDETVARHPSEAFQACGRTCGKFVEMNRKAGLRRTSDILFDFRKAAKPLAGPAKAGSVSPLREALPRLVKLRDDALVGPVGGTGTSEQKRHALAVFSAAVDAFDQAVRANDSGELAKRYDVMMKAMEQAYDLFL